jgi:hypothetical protein
VSNRMIEQYRFKSDINHILAHKACSLPETLLASH